MGVTVREKPPGSGIWWCFIRHQGRRKSKRVGTETNARKFAEAVQARLVLGEYVIEDPEPTVQTFKEYADLWLHGTIKPFRKEATFERYGDILKRFIYPKLGNMPLDKIKRKNVRQVLMGVHKKGLSRASIALVKDVISGPFTLAIDDEIVTANPTLGILKGMHLRRRKQAPGDVFNQDEIELFLQTCLEQEQEHYPLFLTLCHTGARVGEVIGLQWADIDWRGRFILIRRTVRRQVVGDTKTGKERRVDMTDRLYSELEALLKRRQREGLKAGTGLHPYLFHRDGEIWAQQSVRNVFGRILTKAKLRHVRVHDLRHSYASILLSSGVSPVYVKDQLGHSSISMTVDIYGHWIRSTDRAAVAVLDNPANTPTAAPERHPYGTLENLKAVTL